MRAKFEVGLGYGRQRRRRYDAATKLRLVAQCDVPGATVAEVAQVNGVNAKLLHKWRREQEGSAGAQGKRSVASACDSESGFVAVALPALAPSGAGFKGADIRVAVRKGSTSVEVQWPSSAGDGCAAWLAQLLK